MVRSTAELDRLEATLAREAESLDYGEALRRYAALWAYARALRPSIGDDWLDDLEPDLAVARVLNGLPPAA
ncbi:MAG TPA: hypothetical protein VGA37_05265 [Gemmatimonadales bacterium]